MYTTDTKDDYYRSVIAYCHSSALLAVAELGIIRLWSTVVRKCVNELSVGWPPEDEVTSLAFSSFSGHKSILAAGTQLGYIHLWETPRHREIYSWRFDTDVTCVAFKPTTTRCLSAIYPDIEVSVEHLAVGDELGIVWYYAVEITPFEALSRVTLLAKIDAHCTRLCSITWSPDNKYLATGGNDNVCLLFEIERILHKLQSSNAVMETSMERGIIPSLQYPQGRLNMLFSQLSLTLGSYSPMNSTNLPPDSMPAAVSVSERRRSVSERGNASASIAYQRVRNPVFDTLRGSQLWGISRIQSFRRVVSACYYPRPDTQLAAHVLRGNYLHRFEHKAAIKAVAFAPWQPTLLATGGGIADCTVHFYHAPTGSCLAKIYMWAQVTGLIWSTTRREITIVLGTPHHNYDHPYRVVVFAWPSCEQVTAIPWNIGINRLTYPDFYTPDRALSAIRISNFKNHKAEKDDGDFDPEDECIAIATPRFVVCYRIWRKPHKVFKGSAGVMRSEILETFDGIENARNEIIR